VGDVVSMPVRAFPGAGAVWFGTGHRPDKIGAQEAYVRQQIRARLYTHRPGKVISGMALGFDTWWADEALKMGVDVIAAVPFFGQEDRWPEKYKVEYRDLLKRIGKVYMLHMLRPSSSEEAAKWLQERNEWMVNNSHAGVGCSNGDAAGGTANCLRYARSRQIPVDVFDPYKEL
jgi:uncharacterized phage-like protein YoqJ